MINFFYNNREEKPILLEQRVKIYEFVSHTKDESAIGVAQSNKLVI